jgi:hypothetical protein
MPAETTHKRLNDRGFRVHLQRGRRELGHQRLESVEDRAMITLRDNAEKLDQYLPAIGIRRAQRMDGAQGAKRRVGVSQWRDVENFPGFI